MALIVGTMIRDYSFVLFGGVDLIFGTMIGNDGFFIGGVDLIVGTMTGNYSFVHRWSVSSR